MVHEDGSGDATTADGVQAVFDRHVVIHIDAGDLDAFLLFSHFCSCVEVHAVAGIVLDDQERALGALRVDDRVEDLDRGRRGEHVAAHRRVEHAGADEAAVRRFVTAAAAGDQADLLLVDLGAADDLELLVERELRRVRLDHALAHLDDEILGLVDDLLHA